MPFGLTNVPATFQHFTNDLLRDLLESRSTCHCLPRWHSDFLRGPWLILITYLGSARNAVPAWPFHKTREMHLWPPPKFLDLFYFQKAQKWISRRYRLRVEWAPEHEEPPEIFGVCQFLPIVHNQLCPALPLPHYYTRTSSFTGLWKPIYSSNTWSRLSLLPFVSPPRSNLAVFGGSGCFQHCSRCNVLTTAWSAPPCFLFLHAYCIRTEFQDPGLWTFGPIRTAFGSRGIIFRGSGTQSFCLVSQTGTGQVQLVFPIQCSDGYNKHHLATWRGVGANWFQRSLTGKRSLTRPHAGSMDVARFQPGLLGGKGAWPVPIGREGGMVKPCRGKRA